MNILWYNRAVATLRKEKAVTSSFFWPLGKCMLKHCLIDSVFIPVCRAFIQVSNCLTSIAYNRQELDPLWGTSSHGGSASPMRRGASPINVNGRSTFNS